MNKDTYISFEDYKNQVYSTQISTKNEKSTEELIKMAEGYKKLPYEKHSLD
jgi:hypothetical protein